MTLQSQSQLNTWRQPKFLIGDVIKLRNFAMNNVGVDPRHSSKFTNVKIDMTSGRFLITGKDGIAINCDTAFDAESEKLPTFRHLSSQLTVPSTTRFAVIHNVTANYLLYGPWDINLSFFENMTAISASHPGSNFDLLSFHHSEDSASGYIDSSYR